MTIAKAITKTLDISVEDVRIDLTATIRSYDLTDTQFIFEIKSSNGMTANLTGSTAMYIVEYVHNSQTYAIQGDVDIIGTDTLSFNLPEDLKGYSGTVLIGIYVKLTDGTKIDIKDIAVRIEPSIMDKDIDFSAKTYFKDFETVKAEVVLEGEKAKTNINAVVSNVNGYADTQKQAINNIVSDVQSTGDTAKEEIKATLPTLQDKISKLSESITENYSELKEDLGDIYSGGVAPDAIDAEMVNFIKISNPNIAVPTDQTLVVVTKQGGIANVSISFDGTVTVDNPDGAINNIFLNIPTKKDTVYSVVSNLVNYDVTKVAICKSDKTPVTTLKSETQTITTNTDTENLWLRFSAIGKTIFSFKLIVRLQTAEIHGLLDKSIVDISVNASDLSSDFILPVDKTENMQLTGNLFDKNNVIKGAYNYYGTIKEGDDFYYSNLIPIKENQGYTLTKPRFVSIVDKNGVYRKANSDSNPNQFYTKTGDRYVVLSAKISSELELAGLFEGYFNAAEPRNYKPFSVLHKGTLVQSGWYGKRIATLGDSITEMNKWQPYVKNALGCEILNYGIGGTKVAIKADTADYDNTHSMCTDTRVNAIDKDIDCLIFMGGTNDRGQSVPIGSIEDNSTDTFYGALNVMTNKLFERFPTARIIYMTCVYSHTQPGATLPITKYNNAIKDIAEKYHIPCIDVGGYCGWNELNYANYLSDGVHPAGSTGARRMSEIIISSLNKLQPIGYAFEGLD